MSALSERLVTGEMTHVPPAENVVLASVTHAMKRSGSAAMTALLAVVLVLVPSSAMAADPSVERSITVGGGPTGIAITSDGATAYVANYTPGTVSVIRLSDNEVTSTITVGRTPTSVAISPNGGFAYVTNYKDPGEDLSSVSRLDLTVNPVTVSHNITDGSLRGPRDVVFSPDGSKAYVSNQGSNSTRGTIISVITTSSNTVTETITVPQDPQNLAISSDGNILFVSHPSGGRVSVIDVSVSPAVVTTSITGLTLPQGLALAGTPPNQTLYVAEKGTADRVSVYNAATTALITRITGFADPESMTLNGSQAAATQLYVANRGANNVRIINLSGNSLLASPVLTVGSNPFAIAFAPNGLKAYVTNIGGTTVSVITRYQSRTLSFATTSYTVAFGATQTVSATPSAGVGTGTLTYSAGASTACSVNSSTGVVTMTARTGTCSISASISEGGSTASDAFRAANTATPVTINPTVAPLGITATSLTVTSGGTVTPSYSITSGALVSPDALSGLTYTYEGTGSTTYSASTTAPTAIGTYSITPSVATFSTGSSANYNITYNPGALTIQAQSSGSGGSSSGVTRPAPAVAPAPTQPPRQPTLLPVVPNTAPVAQPVERPGLSLNPNAPVRGSVGGAPTNVTNAPAGPAGVSVTAGAFQFGLSLRGPSDDAVATDTPSRSPELQIPRGQSASVSGGGSYPGSFVQLWLPGNGTEARELARIPVSSDGTFVSDLTFGAGPLEMPVPIGRQVLQVVGYDERGNQTVVEMTINIGQGVPAPEPNRQVGALPALLAGQSLATSGGIPEAVVVRAIPDARSASVEGTGWAMSVNVDRAEAVAENGDGDVVLRLQQSSSGIAGGSGFLPGTLATVWLFSDPTLMATITVDDSGSFSADFLVDGRLIMPGDHTLQIQGVGADGFIKAANLGVVVEEPVQLTSDSASGLVAWVVGLFLVAILVGVLFVVAIKRRRRVA